MTKLYTKNTWVDEILAGDERYDILEDGGSAYKSNMQITLSTSVTQAGTTANATRLNNIETGIDAVDTRADIYSLTAKTTPVDADVTVLVDSAASYAHKKLTWANLKATLKTYLDTLYAALGDVPHVAEGRLTLTSGTPVTTSNVTAATTLYYTPHVGNGLTLYTGSRWKFYAFTELSISLSGKTADTNYDVFVYDNSGTVTLELVAWTNGTTRATALVYQDGVLVKSGATTYRYLGTIRTTSTTGQCEDSTTKRFVWNAYNAVPRKLLKQVSTAPWTYQSATVRAWNADATQRVEAVTGQTVPVNLNVIGHVWSASLVLCTVGIGEDSTTAYSTNQILAPAGSASDHAPLIAYYCNEILGYHYFQLLENSGAASLCTFYGNSTHGTSGSVIG